MAPANNSSSFSFFPEWMSSCKDVGVSKGNVDAFSKVFSIISSSR
jgi:hypothetical protein